MAIHFERHPVETAAREAAALLRQIIEPAETAYVTLGRIALLRFKSPEIEAAFAEQLRELGRDLRARNRDDFATCRSIVAGIRELEKKAIVLAAGETKNEGK